MNRASLYGLLNFYREYVPAFAELAEPLRRLLGQDARPWTPAATAAVRGLAARVLSSPRWLNMDASEELRMEARVSKAGLAAILLQRHPEHRQQWAPVASWGRVLDTLEQLESRVILELKALREGAWKLSEYTAFSPRLTMRVSKELRALLKVAPKAHPKLQALLIDLLQYKAKLLVYEDGAAPAALGFEDGGEDGSEDGDPIRGQDWDEDMRIADKALRDAALPAKARFSKGPAIHVQFDGGVQDGHGTGGFVILDAEGNEVVRAGRYYGPGRTNNEAESFALRDAVQCLVRLLRTRPHLAQPVRVFGDSQLMIRFVTRLYKRPSRPSIYWALDEVRRAERALGQDIAYRHVTRDANQVADDMARRALEAKDSVVFWSGQVPADAPANQVAEVYQQQGSPAKLAVSLPAPADWDAMGAGQPSVAALFGARIAGWIADWQADQHKRDAAARLADIVDMRLDGCCASRAVPVRHPLQQAASRIQRTFEADWSAMKAAILTASADAGEAGSSSLDKGKADKRPCCWCGKGHGQARMILCDGCNSCYHPACASASGGTRRHSGPWFCAACKGRVALEGAADISLDWPLIDHLWTGWLPEDLDEADRILHLAEHYRAKGAELQARIPATALQPERWVDVPPIPARQPLLKDAHESLAHCGRDKLLAAVRQHYWWPGMHADAYNAVAWCGVCQRDKPIPPPREELRWIDKGEVPFAGWSIDAAGPFPRDEDGNRYLLVAVDPFSKWVEAIPVPSLHSWRAADFLYEQVIARWGKPRYVRTDNGAEFSGSFARLCKSLGIAHRRITVGNSKANGQVERIIRTLKEAIRRGMTSDSRTYWSNHLAPALCMVRFTPSRMTGFPPFMLATGRTARLPSLPPSPLSAIPDPPSAAQEDEYFAAFSGRVRQLQALGGSRIRDLERRIRQATRANERKAINPTLLFHFEPGQLVARRQRPFSKLDPRALGPFRVRSVSGLYRQRVTLDPAGKSKRPRMVHASQLVPYYAPYEDPPEILPADAPSPGVSADADEEDMEDIEDVDPRPGKRARAAAILSSTIRYPILDHPLSSSSILYCSLPPSHAWLPSA